MERYFFDFDLGKGLTCDEEGSEMPDADAARSQAVKTLTEMARDLIDGQPALALRALIRGSDGMLIFESELSLSGQWLS